MKPASKNIGILAFQGGVIEHQKIIEALGHTVTLVRTLKDFEKVEALIIPGGESTTIGFFLEETGLMTAIQKKAHQKIKPFPIWGTCAGAILLAKTIESHIVPPHLGLMNITIQRNAYGTQFDSFYTELSIPSLKIHDLKAAFIRAPIITQVQKGATILSKYDEKPVIVRQDNLLVSTFHPELRGEPRLHQYFLSLF